jgi:hypothetical protein
MCVYVNTSTVHTLDPDMEAAMYLRNVKNTANIHMVESPKRWINMDKELYTYSIDFEMKEYVTPRIW